MMLDLRSILAKRRQRTADRSFGPALTRNIIVASLFFASALALTACETAKPADADTPTAGIRREPCGGGPVFPPEEQAAPDENGDTPDN